MDPQMICNSGPQGGTHELLEIAVVYATPSGSLVADPYRYQVR